MAINSCNCAVGCRPSQKTYLLQSAPAWEPHAVSALTNPKSAGCLTTRVRNEKVSKMRTPTASSSWSAKAWFMLEVSAVAREDAPMPCAFGVKCNPPSGFEVECPK